MAANLNARFYRLTKLPDFAIDGSHVGLFVYVPGHDFIQGETWIKGYAETDNAHWDGNYPISGLTAIQLAYVTPTADPDFKQTKQECGLWFGGKLGWELLSNVGDGLTLQEVINWFDTNVSSQVEISSITNTQTGTGIDVTIADNLSIDTTGLHINDGSEDSDPDATRTFTVGDGALKITGKAEAVDNTDPQNPVFTDVAAFDVHSANDTVDNTLTFDPSMYITKGDNGAPYTATIGVRVNTAVSPSNPIATMEDIAGLNGAMHLIGTLDNLNDFNEATAEHLWPDQPNSHWTTGTPASGQEQIKAGDTFIVTTAHNGPNGVYYEVGDTVVYYPDANGTNGLNYKVVNTNITDGVQDGQHAHNIGELEDGKLVVAVNPGGVGSNKGIKTIDVDFTDLIVGIDTTQEIVNETTTSADEGQIHGATYTATTTIDRVDDGSDSNISTDIHSFTLHSNNNSLTIQEDDAPDGNQQFNFDLVWLTTMDGFNG